ncbi:UNVERIFIED_CONTAM: Vesicle-associated protein 1-2 [Sesamum radiatum]|uniref:Vesicle-associated protein 1-2 n=1 Tax=Sesamum radiatum TaxID=300843 RepID=A0AAW2MG24_SESRA
MGTFTDMGRDKLLNIEPQELKFLFELRKEASCTIRLINNSRNPVAFKVMTTNPKKYCVRPNIGIVSPRSSCDVTVTMRAPKEIPPNMECKDKFLIKSVVTSPGATVEATRRLFNEKGLLVEECKLRVLYISPSLGQSSNFERPEASSLPNATLQRGNLNDYEVIQRHDRNGIQFGDLFMKGVTVVLVGLIFGYLMLPLIWSLIFMIMMLAIKMINKLVSDSVEDWVVKTLLYACIHFFTTLFRRKEKVPEMVNASDSGGIFVCLIHYVLEGSTGCELLNVYTIPSG